MSPDIERCSGGAPGGASAFPQGDADTRTDDGSAPWRAIPSYPEGRRKTGLPGASIKNTGDGAWLDVSPGQARRSMVDHGPIDCECSTKIIRNAGRENGMKIRTFIETKTQATCMALVLGVATQAFAQTLPPNLPTKEQLANDNNLFIALAKKALKWEEPAEPGANCRPDLFCRHQGTRRLSLHDVRGPHPDEHGHALVRADDCRLDPQTRISHPKTSSS